jgi:extracellular factor (EF) 3-hydroxypalmitic acid methyl ester biosynthesis protein
LPKANKRFVLAWKMFHSIHEMSKVFKGNGNGNGANGLLEQPPKKTAKPPAVAPSSAVKESQVTFQTVEGVELRGTPVRVTRHATVFELYNPSVTPRLSEALGEFQIILQGRAIYSGRAVVRSVVDAGTKIVCEATLNESSWADLNLVLAVERKGGLAQEFKTFLQEWQKLYKVSPEFKIIIADMQTFLCDLRLWLDRVELGIRALAKDEREQFEQKTTQEIAQTVIPLINVLFEKFEYIAKDIEGEQKAAHAHYMRQHLHHLVLAAPFAHRTFEKPLGYAGDYEMVNMITRNGYEGNSLFAKVIHSWFVKQPPAVAHRNRIKYLTDHIELEACRVARAGGTARVFNFACGPAVEVQNFLRSSFRENVELTLADFNSETLEYVSKALDKIKNLFRLRTTVHFQKKTVYQLLKENLKLSAVEKPQFDFVYCAGLFDYLPDTTCKQLMDIFYEFVAPGGLLVATNVEPSNPLRHGMEHLLDWHLIYRREQDLRALRPTHAIDDYVSVRTDATGVNLFIEVRKPDNG